MCNLCNGFKSLFVSDSVMKRKGFKKRNYFFSNFFFMLSVPMTTTRLSFKPNFSRSSSTVYPSSVL